MSKLQLFSDEHARIPFTVIGVFIILGSSITAVYITRLELEKSQEFARSLELNEIENLLYAAETDIANALNIAGMKGLKEIGKHPVIEPLLGFAEEVNCYRVKEMIREELNVYLTGHYRENIFSNGQYAINIVLRNESPIDSAENISLTPFSMQLKRSTLPLIGPNETITHSTYWVASVPLTIAIQEKTRETWTTIAIENIIVSSILTSRYPLMESLVNEYYQTINGTFSPLWSFMTIFSNMYSLVRGFKHYYYGKPLNVVDNRHLAVLLNSGLLLQSCLVYGSVDPLGLVEFARKTKQMLQQIPQDTLVTFNTEMKGKGYVFHTDNITIGSANVDAEDPLNTSINQNPSFNLSEIAERILYNITSVTLHFENKKGEFADEFIVFNESVEASMNEVIQRWANHSFFVTKITKQLTVNTTTLHALQAIISEIYHDTMATRVYDRQKVLEQWGEPGEGWLDGGARSWCYTALVPLSKHDIKPPKGMITPGCGLFEEKYNVTYERIHNWYRLQEQTINGTTIQTTIWNNMTDVLIETVTLQSLLQHYAMYGESQDDIGDVLYRNETLDDLNLNDTLSKYHALYSDEHSEKRQLITTRGNVGTLGLSTELAGWYSAWVLNEAWDSLEEIVESIKEITLDSSINATKYPNPLDLLDNAKNNLLEQFNESLAAYLNYSRYHPGSEFCSVGKKAVYYSRVWYTNNIKTMTDTVFSEISNHLTKVIDFAIKPYAALQTKNITQILDDASDALRNQFTIPFGYTMTLTRYNLQGVFQWNETVRLAIDHHPDYLDPFTKTSFGNEELWSLKLRNRCLFGPIGLPLLPPSPVSPWILTMNLWILDVQGEYTQFKIIDTSDETLFNPLLGHEPQTYVRELKVITCSNTTLGKNTRLSFGFTTAAFGFVPPWGMMLGDIQENWFDDHTLGFDEEG